MSKPRHKWESASHGATCTRCGLEDHFDFQVTAASCRYVLDGKVISVGRSPVPPCETKETTR